MFVDKWRGKGRLSSTAQKVILPLRTCEKGRFLGSNVHMQIEFDIEKYLEHYTDQKGYYSLVPGPFPAENAACPGHLLSSLQANIYL